MKATVELQVNGSLRWWAVVLIAIAKRIIWLVGRYGVKVARRS